MDVRLLVSYAQLEVADVTMQVVRNLDRGQRWQRSVPVFTVCYDCDVVRFMYCKG